MKDIIKIIAENLDELDFDLPESSLASFKPEFTRPRPRTIDHQRNTPNGREAFGGRVYIEICLLDKNGNSSANGDLYNLTDDTELPDALNFMIPMLRISKEFCGELEINFRANYARDDAGGIYDDREIYSAVLDVRENNQTIQQIEIPEEHLDDIFSGFERNIYAARVDSYRERD